MANNNSGFVSSILHRPDLMERPTSQALKMYSGKMAWPMDPRVEDFDIEDIARGICRENRFVGQTRLPISVGWHSLCLSYIVPKELRVPAITHDVTEAYLKDLPRPLKNHPAFAFFSVVENKLFKVMAEFLKLPFTVLPKELEFWDSTIGTAEMSLYNPRGYATLLKTGYPVEKDREAQKLAVKIQKLLANQTVPRPSQEVATRNAWIERLRKLHKVNV